MVLTSDVISNIVLCTLDDHYRVLVMVGLNLHYLYVNLKLKVVLQRLLNFETIIY